MKGIRWRRRRRVHALVASIGVGLGSAVFLLLAGSPLSYRLSMATAYPALVALSVTLLLGPLNVLRGKPNPVSFDLRRDVAIWGVVFALAHVWAGLNVHMGGRYWAYFLSRAPADGIAIRLDAFGVTNHAGLLLTFLLLVLLALSNDAALRKLGSDRWKRIQRLNYLGYLALVLHALIYQRLEQRSAPWLAVTAVLAVTVAWFQAAGFRRVRPSRRSG